MKPSQSAIEPQSAIFRTIRSHHGSPPPSPGTVHPPIQPRPPPPPLTGYTEIKRQHTIPTHPQPTASDPQLTLA
ncbi:hypothetical protein BS50DRAFT_250046 [Corynespora cassiicola Philippines]|uniref:Uncharacterized protein n=1 Tax=Corynespora cassiicola Philippines TaxID=1448308 RepID=A0A2T2P4B9_CORCC|nr:hypothetical protein BS50DRAFT_250046 [Corynespora cassiicola Philippines]